MKLLERFNSSKNQIAVLIDPDKFNFDLEFIQKIRFSKVDYIFIGGSTVGTEQFRTVAAFLSKNIDIPLISFPGDVDQYSDDIDALLYLSLLSGRNPEYLIGRHIKTSTEILQSNFESIPTAYLLLDGGRQSATAYVSQTIPIPQSEIDIIYRTAAAGILQGKRLIYLDSGSGAIEQVQSEIINECASLGTPIIVGGGLKSIDDIKRVHAAGANIAVIGNYVESNVDFLLDVQGYLESVKK